MSTDFRLAQQIKFSDRSFAFTYGFILNSRVSILAQEACYLLALTKHLSQYLLTTVTPSTWKSASLVAWRPHSMHRLEGFSGSLVIGLIWNGLVTSNSLLKSYKCIAHPELLNWHGFLDCRLRILRDHIIPTFIFHMDMLPAILI